VAATYKGSFRPALFSYSPFTDMVVLQLDDPHDMIRGGARHPGAEVAPQPCIRSIRVRIATMMQSYASSAKLRGGGPILHSGVLKPWF
jgi:hypothetical protein